MFLISEADAATREAYHTKGDLSAVTELRRRFPGITDNEGTGACADDCQLAIPAPGTGQCDATTASHATLGAL